MSDSSDTAVDSHQPWPSEGAAGHDDGQQVVSDDDRRDQAGDDTDAQRDGKTLHRRWTHEAQDHTRDKGRCVGVTDGGPRAPYRGVDRGGYGAAGADLLLETLE